MKYLISFLITSVLFFSISLQAQIEKVIVETYYISDGKDATDTTEGRSLEAGSKTYRIYVDLKAGSKIKKIYGDENHPIKILSTANFFNNIDRPTAYFGYLINKAWFANNPTLALDSWLTLGLATKTHNGILKSEDTDSSIIGGTNNYGGSAGVPGGLLTNNDSAAGIPLTMADGLALNDSVLSQWIDNGFKDIYAADTTVFGSVNTGSQFISTEAFLQQNSGVTGAVPDSNKVLVAQLTTKGEISFELNIEVEEPDGIFTKIVKYVANNDTLLADEKLSPYLKYPPSCGCKDPNYLEYSSSFACNNIDSCKTPIVFGCMDSLACNYDPNSNFNIQALCCYPGYCNDRDISIVCPPISNERLRESKFDLYPNPAQDQITLQVAAGDNKEVKYVIYNSLGKLMLEKNIGIMSDIIIKSLDISDLDIDLYLLRVFVGDISYNNIFIKK